jgi:uncharacterized DUF497 family protein
MVRFVWDAEKAELNERNHGVSFDEAATVFSDPLALIIEDAAHPENARIIGESADVRLLLVVFIERKGDALRIISARRVTRQERKRYEEGE